MGYLVHIVLALLAQALVEAGLTAGWQAPWLLLALLPVPRVLAWISKWQMLRGSFRASAASYGLLMHAAPLLHLAVLALGGWREGVERWTGAGASLLGWPGPALLVTLLPYVVFELLVIDARSRTAAGGARRGAWGVFQARLLLSGLAPVAVFLALAMLVGLSETLRVRIEEVALYNALFAAGLLVLLALLLPWLLARTWETAPLPPGEQRDLLLEVARVAGYERPNLRVWHTGHQLANAAIVGLTPRSRVVLFSDALLAQMRPRELAAVFAHEIGHAARWHVAIFALWLLVFLLGGDLLARTLFPQDDLLGGTTVLGTLCLWLLCFSWLSRRFELDADLHALQLMGEGASLASALERVGGRLRDIASWRHFSTAERVRFLERAAADPRTGRALRRTLGLTTALALALCVALAGLQVRHLASTLAEDGVRAALRLGRYEEAERALAQLPRPDAETVALARRGASLLLEQASARRLAQQALHALERGDGAALRDWVRLALLRGATTLAPFESLLDGRPPAPELALRLRAALRAAASPI